MKTNLDEGVIKFKFKLKIAPELNADEYLDLEKWRVILFRMNLIGEYPKEKVGFGNLSKRDLRFSDQFIITGTQTGKFSNLTGRQYTKITNCNLDKMYVGAQGPIAPSSESLTHHALYLANKNIKYVFHVHSNQLWSYMISHEFMKTPKDIGYGTKQMAEVVQKLIQNKDHGILAMHGHQDGVISFAPTAEQAGQLILNTLKLAKAENLNSE